MATESLVAKKVLEKCVYCTRSFPRVDVVCPTCNQFRPNQSQDYEDGYTRDKNFKNLEEDGTILLSLVEEEDHKMIQTGPWDKCFGGGIPVSGVTLIGGQPGAGKSTLSVQIADAIITATGREILYVGAEEALKNIKPRVKRLVGSANIQKMRMVPLGVPVDIISVIEKRKPAAMFLDSLQGWTLDLNEQLEVLKAFSAPASDNECPIIVISQVTKDEGIAGLMAAQHAVDTTMQFLLHDDIRELVPIKNRFGPTVNANLFFDMTEKGLVVRGDPFADEIDEEDEDE